MDSPTNLDTKEVLQLQDEHQRLLRALLDSIGRESEMLRQLRRMKESIVSVALKLQVAVKVVHDDEVTMKSLRKEAVEAKKDAIVANKRADSAIELVHALRLEINSLKRQVINLKEDPTSTNSGSNTPSKSNTGFFLSTTSSPVKIADAEVDAMMRRRSPSPSGRKTPTKPISSRSSRVRSKSPDQKDYKHQVELSASLSHNSITPFQDWKIQRFVWSPDTPQASEYHDSVAVEALAQAALLETSLSKDTRRNARTPNFLRPIKSSAAKTRIETSRNNTSSRGSLGNKSRGGETALSPSIFPTNRTNDGRLSSLTHHVSASSQDLTAITLRRLKKADEDINTLLSREIPSALHAYNEARKMEDDDKFHTEKHTNREINASISKNAVVI